MYSNTLCLAYSPNERLPEFINKYNLTQYGLLYMELANGDLKSIMYSDIQHSQSFYINALVQCYLSLMFFYKLVGRIHYDAHSGNFLYHKIKKGGYFHYKILGIDYYLENIGYLWMLWDYESSQSFSYMKTTYAKSISVSVDFTNIIRVFIHKSSGGFNEFNYINSQNANIIKELEDKLLIKNATDYSSSINDKHNVINNYIKLILSHFMEYKFILTELPYGSTIINNEPYQINGILFA